MKYRGAAQEPGKRTISMERICKGTASAVPLQNICPCGFKYMVRLPWAKVPGQPLLALR